MNHMTDTETVKRQYADSANLNIRIALHSKYSTNRQGFGDWIYQQYHFFPRCSILELGCGSAAMWENRISGLNKDTKLVLSDISEGMVKEAGSRYISFDNVSCEQINIEAIPYKDESFDFVIANMVLHHVPDIRKGLSEVFRVLKHGGKFFCAAFGENGINKYLMNSLAEYDFKLDMNGAFTLQNGADILKEFFGNVQKSEYPDSLEITDTNDLLDYIFSMSSIANLSQLNREQLFRLFEKKKDSKGILKIPKEYGMFISRK